MRTLYLDCSMGAAGDMLTAALLELLPNPDEFVKELNALGIPGVVFKNEVAVKCGITGTHMTVTVNGEEEESYDHDHEHSHDHEHGHSHEHSHNHEHGHDHDHHHDHEDSYDHDHHHDHEDSHDHGHYHNPEYSLDYDHHHDHEHRLDSDHHHDHEDSHDHGHSHEYENNHDHDYGHHHDHEDSHDYEHNHDHEHSHDSDHHHEDSHYHDHEHSHDHEHNHDHDHSHDCDHHHDHDHSHDHEHSHDHSHDHHHHHHSGLHDIEHIVRGHLSLPQKVQDDIMAVYALIAEAESHAHGVPVTEIHFHEVGTMDAIADITAVCMLMERLSPDEVVVSPVHVGSGQVRCAHGILPVPAPATAFILKDAPIYGGSIRGELCTPTGAALLKHFATRFGNMPMMKTQAIGYGMGKKDFEAANCVRAMLGERENAGDEIRELSCNVDDMTGEAMGFAMDKLFEAGALDVYTMSIGMKKSRPGILIHVMCRESDKEAILQTIFKYTTTIGIRENRLQRYVLDRHMEIVDTVYGPVRCKVSTGYGVERRKYEYEDLSRIAAENKISLEKILSDIGK